MNKQERKLREETLLATALHCFATENRDDISVAKIAALAGVAKGTVYLHFNSKDEICARLAKNFYDELRQKYLEITGTGCEQLTRVIKTSFNHYRDRAQYTRIVQNCQCEHFSAALDPALARELQDAQNFYRKRIALALSQGARDKTLLPDAGKNLTGICCTLSGALDCFSRRTDSSGDNTHRVYTSHPNTDFQGMDRTNTQRQSPKEFIDRVTGYILSSVENNTSSKVNNDAEVPSLELTPGVQ